MKLSDVAINTETQENGEWVDKIPEMEGLRLKVRGAENIDWRKLRSRLLNSVPRKKRIGGVLDPADGDRIMALLLRDTGLLDWDGIEGDDGKLLPYSKDMADKLLNDPQYVKFRDAVNWACSIVAENDAVEVGDTVKN